MIACPSGIAVIIVSFNAADMLVGCLGALRQQTVQPVKLIVVDNNSRVCPRENVARFFSRATFISLPENVGFARANNLGLEHTVGCRWVALLNPDAYPEPEWLERMLRATETYHNCTFFGSRMLMAATPEKLDGVGDCYHISGLAWRRAHGCSAAGRFLEGREIFSPCAAAAVYRRDVIVKAGGFDESFFCFFEDIDLSFRLRLMGNRCRYISEAVVLHEGSAVTVRQSDFSLYHGHRNLVWTFFKNMPWPALWLFLGPHIILNLVTVFWGCFHGHRKIVIRAKLDAIKGLPAILAQRHELHCKRVIGLWPLLKLMSWGFGRKSR
ncbi:MAG: glycosyltransferase family 2 protein [Pseudomonadota bacterium]|nr:glycosyltransferase family 2 protein [Pseudomonadota bacterium]